MRARGTPCDHPSWTPPHWPSCLSCPATAWVTLSDCGFKLNSMEIYHGTVANQSDSKTNKKNPERVENKIWPSLVKDKTGAQKRTWNYTHHNVPLASGKKDGFYFLLYRCLRFTNSLWWEKNILKNEIICLTRLPHPLYERNRKEVSFCARKAV